MAFRTSANIRFAGLCLAILSVLGAASGNDRERKNEVTDAEGHIVHDLAEVLHLSQLFYVAQRCGDLPDDNRVTWRRDSFMDDGADVGVDLVGGYFDAGDHVKFGLPGAFTITTLAWSMLQHGSAYTGDEYDFGLENIKWGTDFYLKAHPAENELYAQCGDGHEDHTFWGRPEDYPYNPRVSMKLDPDHPGSDLAGETSAALASASILFKEVDPEYSERLLTSAESIYRFADTYRGKYSDSLPEAQDFYVSNGFEDELVWAAIWLYKATGEVSYLEDAEAKYDEFALEELYSSYNLNDKTAGIQTLLYEITGKTKYSDKLASMCDWFLSGAPVTPGGMLYIAEWGSARVAGYAAFSLLLADDVGLGGGRYADLAAHQVDYILGNNPLNMSYVIGYSDNYPLRPHHRASSCPTREECGGCECGIEYFESPDPNPQILYGALVGGPDENDDWQDDRADYVKNEVALDYNAGIQGAVAGLIAKGINLRRN